MRKLARSIVAGAAAALLLAGGAALAAKLSPAQQQYQQERAACMSGTSNQDRATCLREAGAALQESSRGGLSGADQSGLRNNQVQRCAALPVADRDDCVLRMQGQGSTSGSVQQGGVLRELVRPVPAAN
jgi:hypothetical protein